VPDAASLDLPLELRSLDSLFDSAAEPLFPYKGRMVRARLAEYLEGLVRERPRSRAAQLSIVVREPAGNPSAEERAARDLHAYFRTRREIVDLELRVNQQEGWRFFLRSFPLLVAALVVAGVLFVDEPVGKTGTIVDIVPALVYLLFITIVWVLLWDPIEKLVFDAFLLRSRITALAKLEEAPVQFAHLSTAAGE